jgi:hypothetical protein
MRILSLAAIAALTLGVMLAGSPSSAAQSGNANSPHKKILGYQNPETGEFEPLVRAIPDASSTTPTTGTVEVTLTITVKTPLPKGGAIICGADLTAISENKATFAYAYWYEQGYTTATVSGSTATCTVNVPYSWVVPAASSAIQNSVTGTYSVQMDSASTGTTASTVDPTGTVRYSSGAFLNGAIPTTGSTSKYSVSVVL